MSIVDFLALANNATDYGREVSCNFGCSTRNVDKAIRYAKSRFPDKPFCVVRNWNWIDIEVSDAVNEKFIERGILPSYIYADTVLDDEISRGFHSVITSALEKFEKLCVFSTRNTSYVLVGKGKRTIINQSASKSIIFF